MDLFDVSDYPDRQYAVCCNPGGRWHGWLFKRHPDGQWVSVRKLAKIDPPLLIENERT